MKNVIYSLVFLLLIVSSCNPSDPITTSSYTLSQLSYGDAWGLGDYKATYNGSQLESLSSSANNQKIKFSYSDKGFLTKKELFKLDSNEPLFTSTYTTNLDGQIIEKKSWDIIDGEAVYSGKVEYTYAVGKLREMLYFDADDVSLRYTLTFIWEGDNPVHIRKEESSGDIAYDEMVTYDLSKVNRLNSLFNHSEELYGFGYDTLIWQALSLNVPTSSTITFRGGEENTLLYQYNLLDSGMLGSIYVDNNLWFSYQYE